MKRTVLILLIAVFTVTGISFATMTRVKTMGRVNDFVYDDANVFIYPSTITGFSNRFLFELGEGDITGGYNPAYLGPIFPSGMGGGVGFALSEVHHLGFYVTANDRSNSGGISDAFFPNDLRLDDFVSLIYGYSAKDLDFGIGFNMGKSRIERTEPDSLVMKQAVGRMGFSGGISYWLKDDNSVDLAFDYETTSITDEQMVGGEKTTVSEADGFNTIAFRARLFWNYSDDIQLVPYGTFAMVNRGVKRDSDADNEMESDKEETNIINAALGMNFFPDKKIQVVTAFGITMMNTDLTSQDEDAGKTGMKYLPFIKGGLDVELRDWIDFRAGVEKQLTSTKTENGVTDETSGASFQGYLGAGFHLGDLTIDTQVNPNIFFNGPNFISGASESLNHRVSIVYPW
jgi:hypothetical protein